MSSGEKPKLGRVAFFAIPKNGSQGVSNKMGWGAARKIAAWGPIVSD
jgi:hypothetical protein